MCSQSVRSTGDNLQLPLQSGVRVGSGEGGAGGGAVLSD